MRKIPLFFLLMGMVGLFCSCETTQYINATAIAYQSLCSTNPISKSDVPKNSEIIVYSEIDSDGLLTVSVENNTDRIMVIDRTKTFFRDGNGNSIPYYDPSISVNTQSVTVGSTTGASVNVGSVASALGIGGAVGTALSGVTVGGSSSEAVTNTNTTYYIDQPQVSIPPHGVVSLGRTFKITGVGFDFLQQVVSSSYQDVNNSFPAEQSYASCNLCVAYSTDDGKTFETILTDIYANSLIVSRVRQTGKVNDALRWVYSSKENALTEKWYMLYFSSNRPHSYLNYSFFINCQ